jgi:hypothetical protein
MSPSTTTTTTKSALSCKSSAISFLDLPVEIRYAIYPELYRGRTKWSINLGLLSPAWKSPQPPAALMNTCSSIASELMPLYFNNCMFILDTTTSDYLRQEALKWLKRVGDSNTAHFRRLRVVHNAVGNSNCEIDLTITEEKEVKAEQRKGGVESFSSMHATLSQHKAHCIKIGEEMVDDIEKKLVKRIKSNGTGGLGVAEFEVVLAIIDHHMEWFKKNRERSYGPRRAAVLRRG